MQDRLITRNYFYIVAAQVIYKAFSFILIIVIARVLNIEIFGQFSYCLSFVWPFLFLSDLGMTEILIRDISANKSLLPKYIDNILFIKLILGLACYIVIALLAYLSSFDHNKLMVILVLGIGVIFDSFMYFFRSLFHLKDSMVKEAILIIFEGALKLLSILLVLNLKLNYPKVIIFSIALLISSSLNLLVNFLFFFRSSKKTKISIDFKLCRYLFKNGIPFSLVYVLSLINFRVDIVMLSLLKNDELSGLYNINYKILEQFLLIPLTFAWISLPIFSRFLSFSAAKLKNFFNLVILTLFILSLFIILSCHLLGNFVITLIYGPAFKNVGTYLSLLSWVLLPFFIKSVTEKMLFVFKKQVLVFIIYAAGVIMHIVINFTLIPSLGIRGAALSTIFCESIVVGACFYIMNKSLKKSGKIFKNLSQVYTNENTVTEELSY